MAETKKLLVLRLEGALQSWGETSKWDYRDSSTMPSKSGIVGLLGCALGLERNSAALVELAQNISVAVRADRSGEAFTDYQTVTGEPLMAATGKPKTTGNTIVSPRVYLQDACYTVFIETTQVWMQRLEEALKNPKWCVYLGRKCCVPSRPVFACVTSEYTDLMDAVKRCWDAAETVRRDELMTVEVESCESNMAELIRTDEPVGVGRQFGLRRVWRGAVRREKSASDQT